MAITLLTADTIEDVQALVKARTAEDRAKVTTEPKTSEPPQVARIRAILDKSELRSNFASIDEVLTEIVALATGQTYSFKKNDDGIKYTYRKYTMVVAEEERDASVYKVGQPFLVTLKLRDNGRAAAAMRGGDLGTGNTHAGKWHYATDEEIDSFFAGLSQASKDELLKAFQE